MGCATSTSHPLTRDQSGRDEAWLIIRETIPRNSCDYNDRVQGSEPGKFKKLFVGFIHSGLKVSENWVKLTEGKFEGKFIPIISLKNTELCRRIPWRDVDQHSDNIIRDDDEEKPESAPQTKQEPRYVNAGALHLYNG